MLKNIIFLLNFILISACTIMPEPSQTTEVGTHTLQDGQIWQLVSLNEQRIPPQVSMTISFSREGRINGTGGCNNFFGIYKTSGTRISIGRIGTTKKLCPDLMPLETRFFAVLEQIEQHKLINNGTRLQLTGAAGKLEFVQQ